MFFDVNCYLGDWPFSLFPGYSAAGLAARLKEAGVSHAAVSPFGAVFQPEPMPANRQLFRTLRGRRNFVPLPVLNPALATWREHLTECAAVPGVRAIRLHPNYHDYQLNSPAVAALLAELFARNLGLVLTARIEDERHRYFALNVKAVPVAQLAEFLQKNQRLSPLITGLSVAETLALAKAHRNFSADLAYQENIALAEILRGSLPTTQLMFGTLCPIVSPPAQVAKLTAPGFTAAERKRIGFTNARHFFA